MAAVDEIKDYKDFKRAIGKSDYSAIKAFKDSEPTIYNDFKLAMKQEEDERRGIIKF
jgi:hypothetical protein